MIIPYYKSILFADTPLNDADYADYTNNTPDASKPPLNQENSLSTIFFNNIYTDTAVTGAHTTEDTQLVDINSTPRCATPLSFDNMLFQRPIATNAPNAAPTSTSNLSAKAKSLSDHYENLFAYPLTAGRQTNVSLNDYYTVSTPTASDSSSLSPYQRNSIESSSSGVSSRCDQHSHSHQHNHSVSCCSSTSSCMDDNYLSRINLNMQINNDIDLINNTQPVKTFPSFADANKNTMEQIMQAAHLQQLPISLPSQPEHNEVLSDTQLSPPTDDSATDDYPIVKRQHRYTPKRIVPPPIDTPSSAHSLDKQFKCTQCASSFTRKTRLTEHINRVHMGKIFHFKCNECGTRLSSKENLTRHTIVHTDKFKCQYCDRRFDRSYRYQRHLEKCVVAPKQE